MAIAEMIEESAPAESLQGSAKDRLRAFIERIERLEEEKAALSADIREVFAEAKSTGFDTKALRAIIRMRKQDDHERMEQEALLATYMHALGMIGGLESKQ
ncbi:MAG: DUF2312 domain-containing protein [Rhodomicrobiaceae bacterium]